jgi:hypothetical protein
MFRNTSNTATSRVCFCMFPRPRCGESHALGLPVTAGPTGWPAGVVEVGRIAVARGRVSRVSQCSLFVCPVVFL